MNKIHYKIIYLCCLLTNSTDITSIEINIVDHLGITEENQKIITDIKPAEVIKDKIDIDMDFLIHSRKEFIMYYSNNFLIMLIIMYIIGLICDLSKLNRYNILSNYLNVYNNIVLYNFNNFLDDHVSFKDSKIEFLKRVKYILFFIFFSFYFYFRSIIILIISSLLININYKKKYIKHNILFQICLISTCISLIIILATIRNWNFQDFSFLESCKIWEHNCSHCYKKKKKVDSIIINNIKEILINLILNNLILITTYYTLKGYYHLKPMKYKEKRDYINNLKNINNITPITLIQVLDNDLDNNII
jgi:hypothetical protein